MPIESDRSLATETAASTSVISASPAPYSPVLDPTLRKLKRRTEWPLATSFWVTAIIRGAIIDPPSTGLGWQNTVVN
jgi:hypothetical protein